MAGLLGVVAILGAGLGVLACSAWVRYGDCEWGRHEWPLKWGEPHHDPASNWCGGKKQTRRCVKCNAEDVRRYVG